MSRPSAMEVLHEIFSESAAWAYPSTPIPASIPDELTGQPRKTRQLGKGQPLARQAPATFPFSTKEAEVVWELAAQLILLYPTEPPSEIVRLAIEKSGLTAQDLTSEDIQMLQLAVYYEQNGPAKTNVRTGGTPGGPANASAGRTI